MPGGLPGQGGYPVSYGLGWHGGIHLTAPSADQPVRAIADGTVLYVRKPSAKPDPVPKEHPLNYGAGWTNDGCVVIRHETEIGANTQNEPTKVTFYSITMHLSSIHANAKTGQAIYRKDKIGMAGEIYGGPNQIHFEIICDNDNLPLLVGRKEGKVNIATHGRTDAVYGEMYFRLRPGTRIYGGPKPADNVTKLNAATHPVVHTLCEPLYIGIRYAAGDGAQGNRGDAYVTTYDIDGMQIGTAITEPDAEYNLYTRATNISAAYTADNACPEAVPAPSAVYELLRFGRILGPDALNPANTPHWRSIAYEGGEGWVNLNADDVKKFSDADFPHWRGWVLIDDSEDLDSRCDSKIIKGWLDQDQDGKVDPNEAVSLLPDPEIQARMRRTICMLPTEWEQATVAHRWSWLKEETEENPAPLSDEDFMNLREHIETLAFWEDANIGLSTTHWHFHPREFVKQFRGCGWLSEKTFRRIYPNATAANVTRYRLDLNKCCRKYQISVPTRMGHFFGQAAVESAQLRYMSELFNGDPFNYFRHYAKAKNFAGWLGNVEWDDGGRFRGRGFKQMTGRENYSNYWLYRGWLNQSAFATRWWRNPGWWGIAGNTVPPSQSSTLPIQNADSIAALVAAMRPPIIDQPDVIATDTFSCIDTAGWFWAKNKLIETADQNDAAEMTRKIRGDGAEVGISLPWPNDAHYPDRLAHTQRIIVLIGNQS
ncbi:MAG: hydroxyethylthiazole kinase [Burkholderiales bacterium]|nr:hydroxyethylthiazole kinase [Burkholderiales bacterium]